MPAKFSQHMREVIANGVIEASRLDDPKPWIANTAFAEGVIVFSGFNKYIAPVSGVSGTMTPSHVSGTQTDGGMTWLYAGSLNYNEIFHNNLYMFIGKNDAWANENSPDTPVLTDLKDYDTFNNMITLKKIPPANLKLAARRYNWTSGSIYDQYDSAKDPNIVGEYTRPFFITTVDSNVYKCIDNNNGAASTSSPTGTSTGLTATADGYVWKYMTTIETADAILFMTDDYIPVEIKNIDDGSIQWDVQQAATVAGISTFKNITQSGIFDVSPNVVIQGTGTGADAYAKKTAGGLLTQVVVSSPGTGYDTTAVAIINKINQLGSGGLATPIIGTGADAGKIMSFSIDATGSNYIQGDGVNAAGAVVVVEGDGVGFVGKVVTSAAGVITDVAVVSAGTGYTRARAYIIAGNAGGVATPIMAPMNGHGKNIVSELGATTVIASARLSTVDGAGYILEGVSSDFRQIGIVTDIRSADGNYAIQSLLIGPSHPEWTNVASTLNKIKTNNGYIIFLNNTMKIERSAGQEEDLKIAITL